MSLTRKNVVSGSRALSTFAELGRRRKSHEELDGLLGAGSGRLSSRSPVELALGGAILLNGDFRDDDGWVETGGPVSFEAPDRNRPAARVEGLSMLPAAAAPAARVAHGAASPEQ